MMSDAVPRASNEVTDLDEESAAESEYEEDRLEYDYERLTKMYGGSYRCALKKGISLGAVADKGVEFEIDTEAAEGLPNEDTEGYFDKNLLKFARYDLVYDDDNSNISESTDSLQLTPFEEIAKDAVDISPDQDRGVLKKIVTEGYGKDMPSNAFIRMHYNIYTEFSPEPFDSSRLRNAKQQLRLSEGRTIPGLEIALASMRKGEKALFLIKPYLAFGHLGVPPRIPPNATLLYDVEILEFGEGTAAVEMMTPEEREEEMGFRKVMKLCRGLLAYGNKSLSAGRIDDASDKYNRGSHLLEGMRLKDETEEMGNHALLLKFYNNIALVQEKKDNLKRVAYFSRKALRLDETCCKALFRLGRTLTMLNDYDGARKFLYRAKGYSPRDPAILYEISKLSQRAAATKQQESAFAKRAFGNFSCPKPVPIPVASHEFQEECESMLKDFAESDREQCLIPGELNDAELRFIKDVVVSLGISIARQDNTGTLVVKGSSKRDQ